MRYTHFVFDIDNTLINTTGAVLHGLQRALRDVTGEHWDLSRLGQTDNRNNHQDGTGHNHVG